MQFAEIISRGELYNFHSHTQFCDGRAPMADFAAAAVAAGFTHYGFSPHSPVPIESGCNMTEADVSLYFDEVARLKALYAGRINLYASMEIDYLGPEWGPSTSYFQLLPLDYRIGSVHFIPSQDGQLIDIDGRYERFKARMASDFHDDIRYVADTFFDQSIEMVEQGGFDIIGHFDKIGHNGDHYRPGLEEMPWYRKRVDELIDAIVAAGLVVEINTKSWKDHGRMFPAVRYWKRLKDAGVTIIVNSDAHYPDLINASRAEALGILRAL